MTKGGRFTLAGAPTLAVWIYVLVKELTVDYGIIKVSTKVPKPPKSGT